MGSYLLRPEQLSLASKRWKRGELGKSIAFDLGLTAKQFDEIRVKNRALFPKRGFSHVRPKKISVFMEDEVYDKLSQAALRRGQSRSLYVRNLIQRDIE